MPVLPAVDSTTSPPGFRSPRFSASRIIHFPARSFTDWPGFMNSALPRIVQPVASDACFSLISGVLPIASTTSLLKVISGLAGFKYPANLVDPSGLHKAKADCLWSALLCENHLPDVDIPGEKSGLAVGKVIFPQPPKPVVEAERAQVRPGRAKIVAPDRE